MIAYFDQQQLIEPNSGSEPTAGLESEFNIAGDSSPASTDFGGVIGVQPLAFIRPSSPEDVARAILLARATDGLTVAARGNGHSVSGQAMASGGLVLDMRALARTAPRMELVVLSGEHRYAVDVCGGALWEEVLEWGLKSHGLVPASWTDYLRLTVGGTLSVGGVSGQAFRYGPQVSNVEELEIVTGDGERRVCSSVSQPDLFYGALGGLGQFGVITRARVRLVPAHRMVKWIRVVYTEFAEYTADAEMLIKHGDEIEMFNYVEGFAFVNNVDDPVNGWQSVPVPSGPAFDPTSVPSGSGRILYCLELALYYNDHNSDNVDERLEKLLRPLRYVRGLEFTADVEYVEFLTRVKRAEEEARTNGFWYGPHPWLNILVASPDIADFDRCVFKDLLKDGIGGPMLVYPLLRSKWDGRMSVAVPQSEVFYLVALLRFTSPPDANKAIAQNQKIMEVCKSKGYDFKVYIPHYKTKSDWVQHFDKDWPRFVNLKNRYDPSAILAPGQRIFSRTC